MYTVDGRDFGIDENKDKIRLCSIMDTTDNDDENT